jgi:hypothetical protein
MGDDKFKMIGGDRCIAIPMYTDRREVIGWNSRLSAAGDWKRL